MKLADVRELNSEELMKLKVGDVVWYCSFVHKPPSHWDGDLTQGIIHHIFRRSDGRRQVIALDLMNESTCDIQGFIIGPYQVPLGNVFRPK